MPDPVNGASPPALTPGQAALKRAFDLLLALPGLVLLSPLVLLGWAVARWDTGEAGFFTQDRVGRHGRAFRIVKLRTMRPSDDAGPATTVTTADDVRLTRSGRWLRRSKLDELPQLLNVVRGEMSLVGPRPDVAGFADALSGADRVVLDLRPGITGPATLAYRDEEVLLAGVPDPVAHNRDVVWPDKVRLNREYAASWSLLGDVRYLLATVLGERLARVDVRRVEPEVGHG